MQGLRQHIKAGQVYRRSDLEYYSSAIDRHLSMLTKEGSLIKLSQGLYYAPKSSKFGVIPPNDHVLVASFLKDNDFLIVKPNTYNSLGLGLTQLYNTTWVYNHKRKGEIKLNGKTFEFKCFMDDAIWNLKIKYVGDETIVIRKGKFKCHKFVPVVQTGRYFKSEEDVNFWVTSDDNKIPVLVKAKIPVGVVKMHLVEWSGLKNELKSKIK